MDMHVPLSEAGSRGRGRPYSSSTARVHAAIRCPPAHSGCGETRRTARDHRAACLDPAKQQRNQIMKNHYNNG